MIDNKQLLFGSLQRLNAFPLDANSVFENIEALIQYTDSGTLAYEGQLVSVLNDENIYMVVRGEDNKLQPVRVSLKVKEAEEIALRIATEKVTELRNELTPKIDENTQNISKNTSDIVEINTKIDVINSNIGEINNDISSIKGDITSINTNIDDIYSKIDKVPGDIATSVSKVQSDVNILKDEIKIAKNNIQDNTNAISLLKANIEDLKLVDSSHNSRIQNLETDVAKSKADIIALNTSMAEHIEAYEGKVTTLEISVEELKNTLLSKYYTREEVDTLINDKKHLTTKIVEKEEEITEPNII